MKNSWVLLLLLAFSFTLNAQSWTVQKSGTTDNLRHAYFIDANNGWAVGEGGAILKTTNGGGNWTTISVISNDPFLIDIFFLNSNTGWAAGDGGIFKTTDGGTTWNQQNGPANLTKVFFINASKGWAVGGIDGTAPVLGQIFLTSDGGQNWTEEKNSGSWSRFYGVQFIDENNGWAYTESNGLLIHCSDGGYGWQPQMSYGTSFSIKSFFFIDSNTGFVGGNDGQSGSLLKTTDGGATWTNKTPNLQYGPVYIRFFDKQNGVAAGQGRFGDVAILSTTDGGETWSIQTTTLPSGVSGGSLESGFFVDANNGWAVGDNGVILKYAKTTGVEENKNISPMAFKLEQNYPNPFNPSTLISYQLSSASHVTLKVYNILGKEAATLVNGIQDAGSHSVQFSASEFNLTSGIYFYQLKADGFVSMKKMILMK